MWFPLVPSLACKILHFGRKLTLTCSSKQKKTIGFIGATDRFSVFFAMFSQFLRYLTSLKEKMQKTSSSFSFHILRYKIIETFCIGTNINN